MHNIYLLQQKKNNNNNNNDASLNYIHLLLFYYSIVLLETTKHARANAEPIALFFKLFYSQFLLFAQFNQLYEPKLFAKCLAYEIFC
jgi:hypothetical protein